MLAQAATQSTSDDEYANVSEAMGRILACCIGGVLILWIGKKLVGSKAQSKQEGDPPKA